LALVIIGECVPQSIYTVNRQIANAQRGGGSYNYGYGGGNPYGYGRALPGDVVGARPSVDPSAYYSGANRAKISRMLANYNF